MKYRRIGSRQVSAIGLGGMPMSLEGRPDDRSRLVATIHAALDAGITHIDTAAPYRLPGEAEPHNELLVAEALRSWGGDTSSVLVATKAGLVRRRPGPWDREGRPEFIIESTKASAKALGVEAIGLLYLHYPDPKVRFADSVGALADLVGQGVIEMAGVSNVDWEHIAIAREILGSSLVAVENKYSPLDRANQDSLQLTAELGLAFVPYAPLGGIGGAARLGSRLAAFSTVAADHGVSPQRVALAWLLAKGPHVLPIPGAARKESIIDSAAAVDLELSQEEVRILESAE